MKKKDETSLIHKIIWIPNYFFYPKGFKQWWAMFYNVFLVIAIYRLSTNAADNFLQFLAVVALVFFVFNFIPFQIYRLIIFIFRKKVSKKEKTTSWLIVAIIVGFLCLIVWSYLSENKENKNKLSDHGIKYELISEEKVDEKVCMKGGCSTTVKKVLSSNDGFIFETFLSDGNDSVWCVSFASGSWVFDKNPCSTVGDYGGGRNEMNVISKKTNKSISIFGVGDNGNITRISTPIDYPYIVIKINTGGASCCTNFRLYSKENLVFVSESSSNKYSK